MSINLFKQDDKSIIIKVKKDGVYQDITGYRFDLQLRGSQVLETDYGYGTEAILTIPTDLPEGNYGMYIQMTDNDGKFQTLKEVVLSIKHSPDRSEL